MAKLKHVVSSLDELLAQDVLWAEQMRGDPPLFSVLLPGTVTWRRPTLQRGKKTATGYRRGGVRYPERYEQERDAWATHIRMACVRDHWTPPGVHLPLSVRMVAEGPGKHDLDRLVTAALDALQGGGAIADDCRVKWIDAEHRDVNPTGGARTYISVSTPTLATEKSKRASLDIRRLLAAAEVRRLTRAIKQLDEQGAA